MGYIMDAQIMTINSPDSSTVCRYPLFMTPVPAGFPSPADDYIEKELDFNTYLVKHPAATFFVRVSGDSMRDAGIYPGDILIVDRAIEPTNNSIVIARFEGELTVKRIYKKGRELILVPENSEYEPIEIKDDMDFEIWGVVKHAIHSL